MRIGEESAEKLDVIPPRVQVLRTVRPKYACHHCEGSRRAASAGLLAFIATAKFCDALPLYRQEQQFAQLGVELSRRTMSDWMIAVAGACGPLLEALHSKLRDGPKLAARRDHGAGAQGAGAGQHHHQLPVGPVGGARRPAVRAGAGVPL